MSTLILRRLNQQGIDRFRAFLELSKQGGTESPPADLVAASELNESLPEKIAVDHDRKFHSKLQFGLYLEKVLTPLSHRPTENDVGLWTALAVIYFDQLCPIEDGIRSIGSVDRYILSLDHKRIYRHMVRTPFVITRIHHEKGRVALWSAPHVHGEATEQLTSRQHIYTNKGLFAALDELYMRPDGKPKKGYSGKGKPGTVRRLGKVVKQFDLTYDLHAMGAPEILALLPNEFDRFRKAA